MTVRAAGNDPGQRRLNGPQTTGRSYRNLSEPTHEMVRDDDVTVSMRDGVRLQADVHRPAGDDRFPALVAVSCYPRQIQDLGAPLGFIEGGASDFFVPRGYAHVIANLRGTGGSDGTFTLFDATERDDCHDLVEWVAAQPWCDGRVGMIGISYFAMTQLEAAVERPPHLEAIFPLATSADLYEAVWHHGLLSADFISAWLSGVGVMAGHGDKLWRGRLLGAARRVLHAPPVHSRLQHVNGEAALSVLKDVIRSHYEAHPWDDLWQATTIEHPTRDAFWDDRDLLGRLESVEIPVYLGCDWENVPLHLPSTFRCWRAMEGRVPLRMGLLGAGGLTWPWESMHVEALAWFDHWLKDADTGILDGPPVRYFLPGADEWRACDAWPPTEARHTELALRADGILSIDEGTPGEQSYLCVPKDLGRPRNANPPSLPSQLAWETPPVTADVDMVGEIELRLEAVATVTDTAWIAVLQDVAPDGAVTEVTAGWLRASLRETDAADSRPGAPVVPCRRADAVPPHDLVSYRIPIVPNARRFVAGHRLRLVLASDDSTGSAPTIMGFHHTPVGTATRNTVRSSSRLLIPVISGVDALP